MTEQILARIDDLELRTDRIRKELRDLRELVEVLDTRETPGRARIEAQPPHPISAPPPPRPAPVAPAGASRYAPSEQPDYGSVLRDAFLRVKRDVTSADRDLTFADLFGAKALAWAGGIVTVLGVVFFFVLAVDRGWIGPGLRVTFGGLASAAVLGAGLWLRRRYGETYSSLAAAGAGIAGGYATLLAATALYDLVPKAAALVLAGMIASVGVAVSLAWSAQIVAALGLIGAMVVPALVAFDGGLSRIGTAFVAIVLAATGVVGVRMRWRQLLVAGAVASLPQIALLIGDANGLPWSVVVLAAVFWVLYLGIGIAEQLARDPSTVHSLPATFVLGSAGFLVYSAAVLFGDRGGGDQQGTAFLVAAVLYGAAAAAVRRELGMLLGALALGSVAVGLAQILSGASLTYAWAAEGAVLAWAAQRFGRVRFQLAALAYLALAAGHALLFEASPDHLFEAMRHPAGGALTLAACALALLVVALTVRGLEDAKDEDLRGLLRPLGAVLRGLREHELHVRATALTISALVAVYAGSLAVLLGYQHWSGDVDHAFDLAHVTLTSAWAALGLLALVPALLRRSDAARAVALTWIGLVALKTATFDNVVLTATLRSYAFFAVAGVLLVGTVLVHELDDRIEGFSALALPGLAGTLLLSLDGGTTVATGSTSDGAAVVAAGVVLALVGGLELRLPRLRGFATLLWGSGLAVAAVGDAILVGGVPLVLIWAATAVALAMLAQLFSEPRLSLAAGAYLLVAAAYTLVEETPPSRLVHATLHPGAHLAALALVVAAATVVAQLATGEQERVASAQAFAFWSAGVLGVYALCLGILDLAERIAPGNDVHANFQRGHTAVSGFLGLLGVGLLYAGLKRRSRGLRGGGLALFAFIVGKIFLYDLAALSSAARAVSFLAVGSVLLLGGFFYQRLTSDDQQRLTSDDA